MKALGQNLFGREGKLIHTELGLDTESCREQSWHSGEEGMYRGCSPLSQLCGRDCLSTGHCVEAEAGLLVRIESEPLKFPREAS